MNSGCSQSNTNDEDEVVKKRTSVFVLYVDTLAEEYEEMDRSVLRLGHNQFTAHKCLVKTAHFFQTPKKPHRAIAVQNNKIVLIDMLDPHVFSISVGDDSGFPSRMRQSS